MRKWIHTSGIRILALLLCIGIACHEKDEYSKQSNYQVNVSIDVGDRSLNVSGSFKHILWKKELDSVSFLVHSNMSFEQLESSIFQSVKEEPIPDSKLKRIVFYDPKSPANREELWFDFMYEGQLKDEDMPWGIDRISADWVELSANSMWLPLVESFNVFSTVHAEVTLITEDDYKLVSSGEVTETKANTFLIENDIPQLDFVIIASDDFAIQEYKGIKILSSTELDQSSEDLLLISSESKKWLNSKFGSERKLESAKLVITPREESGYARKNLIVLSDISGKGDLFLTEFITHELTHFWSSKTNPRTPHRWLDESIAQFVAMVYIRENKDPEFYEVEIAGYQKEAPQLPHVYKSGDITEPTHAVLYRKGVVKLDWLEQEVGFERMMNLVRKWFESNSATTEGFLDILRKEEGESVSLAFSEELKN